MSHQRTKAMVKSLGLQYEALQIIADENGLPDDVDEQLTAAEEFALNLPEDLETRAYILKFVKVARAELKAKDYFSANLSWQRISMAYTRACEEYAHSVSAKRKGREIAGGKEGGSHPKPRKFAILTAAHLMQTGFENKEAAWRSLPESYSPISIEDEEAEYEIYRDSEYIIGINTATRVEQKLKKSSFFKNYLKKTKPTGN